MTPLRQQLIRLCIQYACRKPVRLCGIYSNVVQGQINNYTGNNLDFSGCWHIECQDSSHTMLSTTISKIKPHWWFTISLPFLLIGLKSTTYSKKPENKPQEVCNKIKHEHNKKKASDGTWCFNRCLTCFSGCDCASPAQRPEPGQVVRVVHAVSDGDDLLEALNLDDEDLRRETRCQRGGNDRSISKGRCACVCACARACVCVLNPGVPVTQNVWQGYF